MKTILLAAAALIAVPTMAVAQDAPQTTPDTATAADPAATDPAGQVPPTADDNVPPAADGATATPPAAPATPPAATGGAMGTETAGGYQPSQPALSGTPQPGATVRFQPAPSPDQAFPAPAPEANYPICKAGQYDGCMQASDARKPARRRR